MTPAPLRGVRAAVVFLTRIPVGGFPYRVADWKWASAHFPLVGAGLGLLLAALFGTVARAGSLVGGAIVVAAAMLLTGAFHEDGLADTADALGGAYDREKLFVILKDSRVGSFGAGALAIVLILRVALLGRLDTFAPAALVVTQCFARVPPIWLMVAMPYVTMDAAAKSRTVARAGLAQAVVATLWGVLVLLLAVRLGALPLREVLACAAVGPVVALVCGHRFHARAGGITGDFLGATEQVGECAMLLALACSLGAR